FVEWLMRMLAKENTSFAWDDWNFGITLIASAFISVPGLLAARLEAKPDSLTPETIAFASVGMAAIALMMMVLVLYERAMGHVVRSSWKGFGRTVFGVLVPLLLGAIPLSIVYVVTP